MQQKNHSNASRLVPLSNYELTELKLENGQLAMHGLGALTWSRSRACDTLESIVDQATCHQRDPNIISHDQTPANTSSVVASSGGTWTDSSVQVPPAQGWIRKRNRSDSGFFENSFSTNSIHEEHADPSSCASPGASVRLCRDNYTTISTLVSFESPPSLKTKSTDEDSACHGGLENRDDGRETIKGGKSSRSHSTRPRRTAAVHNQSERKRRDLINQKMKVLQRLVPNASKTDKASMLDEVIKYLQQLQAQVQMMHNLRNFMPNGHMNMNMMVPLEMQQQHLHQMSFLAHMGIGMGTYIHPTPVMAAALPSFMPPFMMPPLMPPHPPPQAKPEPISTNNAINEYGPVQQDGSSLSPTSHSSNSSVKQPAAVKPCSMELMRTYLVSGDNSLRDKRNTNNDLVLEERIVYDDDDDLDIEERMFAVDDKVALERYRSDPDYRFLHYRVSALFAHCIKRDIRILKEGMYRRDGDRLEITQAATFCEDRATFLCYNYCLNLTTFDVKY